MEMMRERMERGFESKSKPDYKYTRRALLTKVIQAMNNITQSANSEIKSPKTSEKIGTDFFFFSRERQHLAYKTGRIFFQRYAWSTLCWIPKLSEVQTFFPTLLPPPSPLPAPSQPEKKLENPGIRRDHVIYPLDSKEDMEGIPLLPLRRGGGVPRADDFSGVEQEVCLPVLVWSEIITFLQPFELRVLGCTCKTIRGEITVWGWKEYMLNHYPILHFRFLSLRRHRKRLYKQAATFIALLTQPPPPCPIRHVPRAASSHEGEREVSRSSRNPPSASSQAPFHIPGAVDVD
ncbi:hypothetical protein AAMO2058_000306200, partial [Amorphochlora amoebiformis]